MKINLRSVIGAVSAVTAMMSAAAPAHAWTYTATGQWASFNFGNWTVYQNEWGSSVPATLYANSASDWATAANWTGDGTKGYAHVQLNPNLNYSIWNHWASTGWNSLSNPGGTQHCNWFFDVWTYADELMIIEWSNNSGTWGTQIASNVTINGRFYSSVWQAYAGHNVILFAPGSNRTGGSENLMPYLQWTSNQGKLWNGTLTGWDFGVEETNGNGQWTCNGFWGAWG